MQRGSDLEVTRQLRAGDEEDFSLGVRESADHKAKGFTTCQAPRGLAQPQRLPVYSGIVTYSRNVKRWQGGKMVVRWVSAAIVEAEKKFRRVQGWQDIQNLVRALEVKEQKQEATAESVA